MWFKNLQVYQFIEEFDFNIEQLEAALQNYKFKPCASILPMSSGWQAPIGVGEDAPLIHVANGIYLLSLRIEEKILPSTVIRDQLQEQVLTLQEEQGRKLSSKEKLALKEDIYSNLLPRAFSKNSTILAMIDPKNQYIMIDCSSKSKAEDFITFLRKSLGSLPVAAVETVNPTLLMTKWLKSQKTPRHFELVESCTLYDPKLVGATVRCNKQDLLSPNIQAFLQDGLQVNQLQLQWKDHLQFTLKEDFSITQIKYTDAVQDLAADIHTETAEQQQDASFFIMSQTINEFLADLLHVFRKE
jgi:recombination associated protein RdgC